MRVPQHGSYHAEGCVVPEVQMGQREARPALQPRRGAHRQLRPRRRRQSRELRVAPAGRKGIRFNAFSPPRVVRISKVEAKIQHCNNLTPLCIVGTPPGGRCPGAVA